MRNFLKYRKLYLAIVHKIKYICLCHSKLFALLGIGGQMVAWCHNHPRHKAYCQSGNGAARKAADGGPTPPEASMVYTRRYSKYRARRCECMGERFDSEGEMRRWLYLLDAQRRGELAGLRRQVRYELVPAQWEELTVELKTRTKTVRHCAERAVEYVADFAYTLPDGTEVVEDYKGVRTPEYRLKRKLMLWLRGVRVREVSRPAEPVDGMDSKVTCI